jgi:hypothetical protein
MLCQKVLQRLPLLLRSSLPRSRCHTPPNPPYEFLHAIPQSRAPSCRHRSPPQEERGHRVDHIERLAVAAAPATAKKSKQRTSRATPGDAHQALLHCPNINGDGHKIQPSSKITEDFQRQMFHLRTVSQNAFTEAVTIAHLVKSIYRDCHKIIGGGSFRKSASEVKKV